MCDTAVALGSTTIDGKVHFLKNTDRDANEAHELVLIPAKDHSPDSVVECTYIKIPQIAHTNRVFLAKPFWIWGAEMGVNEHGVTIGNEAVFTKIAREKAPGLIGMDLLRLALERADTAFSALKVICELLKNYGQGGNCGFGHPFYYDNSFIIADRNEAWVLETAGRHWAAEKVKDLRSISNALTIGKRWDLASENLVAYAVERGWCRSADDFDFAHCYSEPLYTYAGAGVSRQVCTTSMMHQRRGRLDIAFFMAMSRLHASPGQLSKGSHEIVLQDRMEVKENPSWLPDQGFRGAQVCMHTGWGPARESQSVGSMIVRLDSALDEIWVTGTSAPCTGIYKPVWLDAGLPDLGPSPKGTYDAHSLWWQHELLHREVLRDYKNRLAVYSDKRDALESHFLLEAQSVRSLERPQRLAFSVACFKTADEARLDWLKEVQKVKPEQEPRFYYRMTWNKINARAKLVLKETETKN